MQLEPWPIPSGWASLIDEYSTASLGAAHSRETVKLRRSHLAHLARGLGGEPWAVTLPQLLGHASVATTQRYIKTDDAVLRAMMERRAL